MKLSPIEKSEYFEVRDIERGWKSIVDKNGKEVMIFSKDGGDKFDFYKTGVLFKSISTF